MIPLKYRQLLPPYWYENTAAFYHFSAAGEESDWQHESIKELGKQFRLAEATYGLDVWDWIYFGDKQLGTYERRREEIRKKNLAKANFTLEVLEAIGRTAGVLKRVSEHFGSKEIWFEFDAGYPVNAIQLSKDFERIRPVHVKRGLTVADQGGEQLVFSASTRTFEVGYLLCGTFYPDDDLEGRLLTEALVLQPTAHIGSIDYQRANTFFTIPD
jgi:hypothetical protein